MDQNTKIAENLFNPEVSVIMAELEGGPKQVDLLSEKLGVTTQEIQRRLAYLVETGYVIFVGNTINVDHVKLAKFMENEDNYKGVVDGLTELDSYLN